MFVESTFFLRIASELDQKVLKRSNLHSFILSNDIPKIEIISVLISHYYILISKSMSENIS